jgi:hypothetical protein
MGLFLSYYVLLGVDYSNEDTGEIYVVTFYVKFENAEIYYYHFENCFTELDDAFDQIILERNMPELIQHSDPKVLRISHTNPNAEIDLVF